MRILVTGAAGYIGRAACRHLRQAGHEVTGLDRVPAADKVGQYFQQADLASERDQAALLYRYGDVESPDCILHLAARAQAVESGQRPLDYWRDNVTATEAVLRLAERLKVPRLVFSSTAAVYGEREGQPGEREDCRPMSLYAQSKRAAEWLLEAGRRVVLPDIRILRIANVAGAYLGVGERLDSGRLIPRCLAVAAGLQPELELRTIGSSRRDYIHLADVCELLEMACRCKACENSTFNLGSGRASRIDDVLDMVYRTTGRAPSIRKVESPDSMVTEPIDNVPLVRRVLDMYCWKPQHGLAAIVASAWSHVRAQVDALQPREQEAQCSRP